MRDRFGRILEEALAAVVAVAAGGVVPAVGAHAARNAPGHLVQVEIEAALPGVSVTLAGWKNEKKRSY